MIIRGIDIKHTGREGRAYLCCCSKAVKESESLPFADIKTDFCARLGNWQGSAKICGNSWCRFRSSPGCQPHVEHFPLALWLSRPGLPLCTWRKFPPSCSSISPDLFNKPIEFLSSPCFCLYYTARCVGASCTHHPLDICNICHFPRYPRSHTGGACPESILLHLHNLILQILAKMTSLNMLQPKTEMPCLECT